MRTVTLECCHLCEAPKFPQGLLVGDETTFGRPVCTTPGCLAYLQPGVASAAYREFVVGNDGTLARGPR